MVDKWTDHIGL